MNYFFLDTETGEFGTITNMRKIAPKIGRCYNYVQEKFAANEEQKILIEKNRYLVVRIPERNKEYFDESLAKRVLMLAESSDIEKIKSYLRELNPEKDGS